ncbi:MAG: phosphodiester glycosidase family protein [Clostridia bacterium]
MRQKKPMPGILIVFMDVLLIGVALVIFAYFHHVRPVKATGPKQHIVFGDSSSSLSPTDDLTAAPPPTDGQPESPQPGENPSSDQPESTDTPVQAGPVGDFSATFPTSDTGAGALYSYQTDDIRIAVTQNKKDEATYFVADVWIRNIQQFHTAFATGQFERGSAKYKMPLEIANSNSAKLAITGDYCSARSSGLIIRNGDLFRDSISEDICILYADGVMETYYRDQFKLQDAIGRGAYQSWSFGPKLLDGGQRPVSYDGASENLQSVINNRDPRAAIGYYEPGHYCLVVVDGRQGDYSRGMSVVQLSNLFVELGCKDAYNLDGGQTAAMIYDGAVISKPYKDGRIISDIIYFGA